MGSAGTESLSARYAAAAKSTWLVILSCSAASAGGGAAVPRAVICRFGSLSPLLCPEMNVL